MEQREGRITKGNRPAFCGRGVLFSSVEVSVPSHFDPAEGLLDLLFSD